MEEKKTNGSILVAGGYHSQGIEEILKRKNISYLTIRPNLEISEIGENYHPLHGFKRDLLPLEKMFYREKVSMAEVQALGGVPGAGALTRSVISRKIGARQTFRIVAVGRSIALGRKSGVEQFTGVAVKSEERKDEIFSAIIQLKQYIQDKSRTGNRKYKFYLSFSGNKQKIREVFKKEDLRSTIVGTLPSDGDKEAFGIAQENENILDRAHSVALKLHTLLKTHFRRNDKHREYSGSSLFRPPLRASGSGSKDPWMFGLVDPLKEAMIQFVAGILLPSMVLIALSFTPFNFWVKIALVTGTGILGIELVQPYLMAFPGHQKYGEKDRKILVGLLRGFGYAGLLVFLLGAAGHILSGVDYQPASHILGILIPSMLSGYLAIFLPHSLNNFFNPVRASGTGGIGRGHLVKRAKELAAILAMPEGPAVEESLAQFSNRSPQEGPIIEVDSWAEVLEALHEGGLDDQSIPPISLVDEKGHPVGLIEDGDTVLYWNFRTDRAKPLTAAFLGIPSEDQTGGLLGNVPHPQIHMVTMTEYDGKFEGHAAVVFQPPPVLDTYAEVVGRAGVRQWVVGESEKHKAIAWFKNGRKNLGFTQSSQNHFDAISAPVRTYLRKDLGIEMHVVESR
ncbi:MAG: hypothetical protein HYY07_03530 [Elusimicrobia bacterium]|nr:hypothetical protein [Elusimicrobiota bacterium]